MASASPPRGPSRFLARDLIDRREAALIAIIAALVIAISIRAPAFLSAGSLDTLLTDGGILAMVALAQMLSLITGGVDLSVAAVMALVGMITALASRAHPDLPVALTVLVALGLGTVLGAVNGVLIAFVRMPPIVVTLGTMSVYRGAVFLVSGGTWVNAHEFGPDYLAFPTSRTLGITHIVWIAAIAIAALYVLLAHTARGRELYALGGSPAAARYVGVRESRALMRVYCLTGLVAGLAGYLWVARYAVAYTETALGFELQTIAACVIGGVSVAGGKGRVLGGLLGAAFLVIILNSLPMIDVSPFWQMAISGAAILAAVIVNSRAEGRRRKVILPRAGGQEAPR
jgi:rhamnose transport system permease protein